MQPQNESTTHVLPKAGFWPGNGVGLLDSGFLRIVFGLVTAGLTIAGVWALQRADVIDASAYFTPTQLWIAVAAFVVLWTLSGFVTWGRERTYMKAGEPRWSAWVPLYNTMILYTIAGMSAGWALLDLVPSRSTVRRMADRSGVLGSLFAPMYVASAAAETTRTITATRATVELARRFGKKPSFVGWFYVFGYGYVKLGFDDSVYNANPDTAEGFEYLMDAKAYNKTADTEPVAQSTSGATNSVPADGYVPPASVYVDATNTAQSQLPAIDNKALRSRMYWFFVLLSFATPITAGVVVSTFGSLVTSLTVLFLPLAALMASTPLALTVLGIAIAVMVHFAMRMFARYITTRYNVLNLKTALGYMVWPIALYAVVLLYAAWQMLMSSVDLGQQVVDVTGSIRRIAAILLFVFLNPFVCTGYFMSMYAYCRDLTISSTQRAIRSLGLFFAYVGLCALFLLALNWIA